MSLDSYSIVVASGLFVLTLALIGTLIAYLASPVFRRTVHARSYGELYGAIAAIILSAIGGALIYQLAYVTPVCELCWWQRVFLFPLAPIAVVAAIYKTREARIMIAVLAVFGAFYAGYHYYYHFQRYVLGNVLTLPCSYGGLLPACTDSPILTFGFVTIPFMSFLVFLCVLIITLFVQGKVRAERA